MIMPMLLLSDANPDHSLSTDLNRLDFCDLSLSIVQCAEKDFKLRPCIKSILELNKLKLYQYFQAKCWFISEVDNLICIISCMGILI